ncbi:acyl-CoA dehydrogenase/oxidase [Polychytrium aggregatum]|uniref:acyl-CoA dehydrogenase/oxidase n=1 Tax=Polychytrium aggregatum TaxID=110093 RepID=UPI0022FE1741|nr:acyl-CoA dehydrogenase/oxidase [Polychytrium aggregatum]KAI9201950.1 acyl-CoA dehydrogenase/oxidase [Polychytrium aggregatum]
MKTFTREEVARHNTPQSAYIIIDSRVYDITRFAALHPGGEQLLLDLAGKDVTGDFYGLHSQQVLHKYAPRLLIGSIEGENFVDVAADAIVPFPYAESNFWFGHKSPYYKESHVRFRQALRSWLVKEIVPDAASQDDLGKAPSPELYQKFVNFGAIVMALGPGPHLKGYNLPGGVKPEEFDYFHEMIWHEETSRLGHFGYITGFASGTVIGLPPLINFGKNHPVAQRMLGEVLSGKKRICLAITEPYAGSDVAQIRTTAVKSPCGKFYIVNGVKKWITNGCYCDYFTTAVRTGGPGMGGISVLLIERTEGVQTKHIKTSYSASAGTAYVIFENVKVPVENLLGKENHGFPIVMSNFNHERWVMICSTVRQCRKAIEDCMKWANQRVAFDKKLIEQPVIRFKLAGMISEVESIQNWLENVTYQMNNMSYKEQSDKLAGPIALLKFQATRVATKVSDNACQIFGGRAITKTGMGSFIEGFQRTFKFQSILGGSEEVLADLGVRQAMRSMPQHAKL